MLAAEGAQGALQAAGTHLVGALHAHLQAGTELVLVPVQTLEVCSACEAHACCALASGSSYKANSADGW